ncbi:major facilitator superfamily transporter [Boeremia exigua]|uniref:major facilitator superfamily transporter n=1 Tax=Boeremia exigua TaxID=749465 RepID=UPI001E8EE37D|nr:major facilitator superfamily transporter [Boeremia exigua]KAH6637830.1 major facilitator superfamily transporter [Boeremia exigua]
MSSQTTHQKDAMSTIEDIEASQEIEHHRARGTVKLLDDNTVILIPTPSPDPKDPLNLPKWHKFTIVFIVAVYGAFSVLCTSALGAVAPVLIHLYPPEDAERATDLLTYPTLFMGIGNLISMPLCEAIGRRPVFLATLVLCIASSIWCANAKTLSSHIAGRNVFSLAAGQSEALAPMIVQEIFFLHERGRGLAWFVGIENVIVAVMFYATTVIIPNPQLGLKWWYGIIAIINAALLTLAYVFLYESKYNRPSDAESGEVHLRFNDNGEVDKQGQQEAIFRVTTAQTHRIDEGTWGPRTWKHSLKLISNKPNWWATVRFYKETGQGLLIPTLLWLLLLNGAYLGVYVYHASTFAQILAQPPYLFKNQWLGLIQLSQVVAATLVVPLLGYGSDIIVKMMSRRHKGVYEPEFRLISLAVPVALMIMACVIYGRAAEEHWHWAAIALTYHIGFFAFNGANLVAITYLVDSFPSKAGPLLLLVCAGRGFISFGLSYSTVPAVQVLGYKTSMNIFAIVCGVLGGIAIPAYFFGKRVRETATRLIWKL